MQSILLPQPHFQLQKRHQFSFRPKIAMDSATAGTYDRKKELHEFDDSKSGVKGLVDAGTTTIPKFFIHPIESRPQPTLPATNPSDNLDVPVIDLSGANDPVSRQEIIGKIHDASRDWGFFQVINHRIPQSVLDSVIAGVRSFHELPASEKAQFYRREGRVSYASNFDLFVSKAASWRDTLQVSLPPPEDTIPECCREGILAWAAEVLKLGEELMGLLCEGMGGVSGNRLKEMSCLDRRQLVAHYYPWCPQPELTWGTAAHSDPGVLTVLLQDRVGGLQVRHGDQWIDVKPVEGALVINIADLLQMISNGLYKSVEHRVSACRSREPRISLAIFFLPGARDTTMTYGPLPELVSKENPPKYCQFTLGDYLAKFFNKGLDGTSLIDAFKI